MSNKTDEDGFSILMDKHLSAFSQLKTLTFGNPSTDRDPLSVQIKPGITEFKMKLSSDGKRYSVHMKEPKAPIEDEALDASIVHWEEAAAAEVADDILLGSDNCPLCVIHNNHASAIKGDSCYACPVKQLTGNIHCKQTPYIAAYFALNEWKAHNDSIIARRKWRAAAQAELDFLKKVKANGTTD